MIIMFVSVIFCLFFTFKTIYCVDDKNFPSSIDDKNFPNTFDDRQFNEFYTCFKNCATSNSVDIERLDDLFSDDKICNTLTTNKNVVKFIKCYINNCKLDLSTVPVNTVSTPSQKIDDKKFNCPGFDPTIFSTNNIDVPKNPNTNGNDDNGVDDSKKSTSDSYKSKHFGYISILAIILFNI